MKILVTGDIHGRFAILNDLINRKKPELVICCGDFGYWPKIKSQEKLSNIKLGKAKLLWCDGNHEDHWSLRNRTTDELEKNIFYMPRGSTYTLEDGRTILFMGGADSIDKDERIIGFDWFPDEVITYKDLLNLPKCKVDIVISHTCPLEIVPEMARYRWKQGEPSNKALSEIWNIYKPSLAFFGHWHRNAKGILETTEWFCLSQAGDIYRWWMWLPQKIA